MIGEYPVGIRPIPYNEWLLKFVVSVQWRVLTIHTRLETPRLVSERIKYRFDEAMSVALHNWAEYLLGNSATSGQERHYVIFLHNVAASMDDVPERLNDRINTYLLRTVDSTLAFSGNNLLLYAKLGPIVLITALRPYELKSMKDAQVKKRGSIGIGQNLRNTDVNEFIWVTRPNDAMSKVNVSEKQIRKMNADFERKLANSKHLHQIHALESDFQLRERRRRT